MLKKISLANFKPFGEQGADIDLGRITVFIGGNGTGKSSVLQSLALLKQSAGKTNLIPGPFKFSSYGDLVHDGYTRKEMRIAITGAGPMKTQPSYNVPFSCEVTFADPGQVVAQRGTLHLDLRQLWSLTVELGLQDSYSIVGEYRYGDAKVRPERIGTEEAWCKIVASPDICMPLQIRGGGNKDEEEFRKRHQLLGSHLRSLFEVILDSVNKVSIDYALRGFDSQSYPLENGEVESPEQPGQVFSTFAYRRDLEQKVSSWLEKITGSRISVHIVPGREVKLKDDLGFDIYQGGFGTNQLIRPLLLLAISPAESLIAIEEPEIHLHPAAQVNLCDKLADIATEENKQILLTTHSEHILTGFLNIVAEGKKLALQDLSVYYFEKEKGVARATKLKVDEKGGVEGGLRGFFEVNLASYQRHIKALSRRAKP